MVEQVEQSEAQAVQEVMRMVIKEDYQMVFLEQLEVQEEELVIILVLVGLVV
jgi:hypothetical protein